MNSLPWELVSIILEDVEAPMHAVCPLVCKQWNNIYNQPEFKDTYKKSMKEYGEREVTPYTRSRYCHRERRYKYEARDNFFSGCYIYALENDNDCLVEIVFNLNCDKNYKPATSIDADTLYHMAKYFNAKSIIYLLEQIAPVDSQITHSLSGGYGYSPFCAY